jgi:hypothetical protein
VAGAPRGVWELSTQEGWRVGIDLGCGHCMGSWSGWSVWRATPTPAVSVCGTYRFSGCVRGRRGVCATGARYDGPSSLLWGFFRRGRLHEWSGPGWLRVVPVRGQLIGPTATRDHRFGWSKASRWGYSGAGPRFGAGRCGGVVAVLCARLPTRFPVLARPVSRSVFMSFWCVVSAGFCFGIDVRQVWRTRHAGQVHDVFLGFFVLLHFSIL